MGFGNGTGPHILHNMSAIAAPGAAEQVARTDTQWWPHSFLPVMLCGGFREHRPRWRPQGPTAVRARMDTMRDSAAYACGIGTGVRLTVGNADRRAPGSACCECNLPPLDRASCLTAEPAARSPS